MALHAFNQRILAEDLLRVRRPDDRERYAASQRQARIDPNPHQIDAVIFALRRLREGGCILADEVGLGKTIEAGLVLAQSLAEGAERGLLIVPKSLIGQWQDELLNLFGIQAREDQTNFFAPGVYLVGREFAGSERGAERLGAVSSFDLVVIDEAHEIFAGLHKRYGRDGLYDETSDEALMAHRVRGFLRTAPVLLLTATPMQNSLAELWGLVQYVEPTGTLLGDITTFRQVFCSEDDRTLIPGQEHELQRRLATVLQRTLRRQAQEFLARPFTQRRYRLYEYAMTDDERSLYDDVTEYLLQPLLYAFAGRQRRLLLIGFHRRMASSIPALAASLENVAARLRRLGTGQPVTGEAVEVLQDLEEDQEVDESSEEAPVPVNRGAVATELARVDDFVARARSLPHDAKARSFQDAIRVVLDLGRDGRGSGKAVVFTESITTQEYLRKLLLDIGLGDEAITLFRGANDHSRAQQAHARWLDEEGSKFSPGSRPTREVAVRLALVHEFRTRSKILVSALSLEFETDLRNIYSRSRTLDEVTREIAALRDKIEGRRDADEKKYQRTSQIIESRFDEEVRKVFKRLGEDLPEGLVQLDRDLADLVEGCLASRAIAHKRFDKAGRVVFEIAPGSELATEIGDGLRFATGDARGLTDAEPLNLAHPLVRAAIADARAWPGGSVDLLLPRDATPELAAMAGKVGVLAVAMVDYAGFEPVQRLIFGGVAAGTPIDPLVAARIGRLRATDSQAVGVSVDPLDLNDAIDEATFIDQRETEKREQKHFERAIGQLERFVDDKVLVCRRERASIADKLRSATARRDAVVGSTARDRVEEEISRLATKDDLLERRMEALDSREDEVYRKWRNEYHKLRYRAPTATRLFQVAFRIAPVNRKT